MKEFILDGRKYFYFIFGDIYLENEDEVVKAAIKEDHECLSSFTGDFTLVVSEQINGEIKIISDRPGKKNIFYYYINSVLWMSDDFWDIKNELGFGIEDVDVTALKYQIVFFSCLGNRSLLKNVKTMPAASIVKIDLLTGQETSIRYWYFRYIKNNLSHDEKLDLIDETFNRALQTIKKLNPAESSFAVGVSGGLDSRLIPYYALKNDMPVEGFTIGIEKPRKLFLSNDFNSANKIAEHFNIGRRTLPYNSLSFEEQLELECERAPEISSQMFKVVDPAILKSNILITGASGFVIGASPMYGTVRNNELIDHTLLYQTLLSRKPKGAKYSKAISSLTGLSLKYMPEIARSGLGDFFSKAELEDGISELESFYSEFDGLSNSEKMMNYAIFGLGRNNSKGAFESFLGQTQSYSIYTPFFLDIVPLFNEDELLNRKLFQQFIVERLPELSAIQGQEFKPTMSNKMGKTVEMVRKLSAMGNFVIRGNGVMNYQNWSNTSEFISLQDELSESTRSITDKLGISFDFGEGVYHSALRQNIIKMQKILLKF